MSEAERRRNYRYDRVLIETTRILSPQFDPAVVYLTGAQIELLRNMTQYLRRLETYVTTYAEGYYLTPTVADYDDLLAIVADLEETLMGNPNVIWGYKDRWTQDLSETKSGDGDFLKWVPQVPAGYVYVVQFAYMRNDTGQRGAAEIEAYNGMHYWTLERDDSLAANELLSWVGNLVLKESDQLNFFMGSCLNGDVMHAGVWGYTMEVP